MDSSYRHSVTLDKDKCKGCTNCLKHCPTEAIRIRERKAHIIAERCIDCGECIRICPYHAKEARTDPLASINRFQHKIALPAPALYGQFKNLLSIDKVRMGFLRMGFDAVYDVALGAEMVSRAIQEKLKEPDCPRPLISSACPAIVRLIQISFPELLPHVVSLKSPMEAAAIVAKQEFCQKTGVDQKDVGAFFITPCAAKMTAIRAPIGHETSAVDGSISIVEMYGLLSSQLKQPQSEDVPSLVTSWGVGWANSGGESFAVGSENSLAVDGIQNVIRVLEEMENNKLNDLDFFEGLSCIGGCVGGPLVFENSYVAKNRVRKLIESLPKKRPEDFIEADVAQKLGLDLESEIMPHKIMQLDNNLSKALLKMEQMESLIKTLPGLDCGSCGSPTCRALAEDVVRGDAVELDCLVLLKERVSDLARQMVALSGSDLP